MVLRKTTSKKTMVSQLGQLPVIVYKGAIFLCDYGNQN